MAGAYVYKKTSTIETIGKQLINDFRAYYKWSASEWNQYCKELSEIAGTTLTPQQIQFYSMLGISTLSMIDLTKIDDLEKEIDSKFPEIYLTVIHVNPIDEKSK